jgi:hypothetical protein
VAGAFGRPRLTAEQLAEAKGSWAGRPLPLFSWRVALLPYLGDDRLNRLYKQFRFNEPWDSAHNKKLLAWMPPLYAAPTGQGKAEGLTYYRVFVGKDAPFNGTIPPSLPATFKDGPANTFLVVEAGDPVPWTKPEGLPYAKKRRLPPLRALFHDGFNAVMADGSARIVPALTSERTIRAFITPAGGEKIDHR